VITVEKQGGYLTVGVFGQLELADYRRFEDEVIAQLEAQGRVNLLIDLRDMAGYTLDVALEDIRFTRRHRHDVGRIAILSEREWVKWTTLLTQLFLDTELEIFSDEAAAKAWLGEA
jgi:hypothetical protein